MNNHQDKLFLEFVGAAETVTGSRTKVSFNNHQFYVDCGMFQGPKAIREKNWQQEKDLEEIEGIFVTHAHIDHSGYIPKIVREGFKGPIYCTRPTYDLCQLMLRDSAHIQESDAEYLGRRGRSHHRPPKPLYTIEDVEVALKLFHPVKMNQWFEIASNMSVRFLRSGHILGAAFVQFSFALAKGVKILTFSGDIGNSHQNLIKSPAPIKETDYLVMEGTYGDRNHAYDDMFIKLEEIIHRIYQKKSTLVIPAFAVGRTQELLYILRQLELEQKIPKINIYVDSPMANKATGILLQHREELKHNVTKEGVEFHLCPSHIHGVESVEESKALMEKPGPKIIISASGMLSGGRVLHHLKKVLPHPDNEVLIVGFQAQETKGQLLQNGIPKIRIHKELIDVKARVSSIDALSAHADSDGLLEFAKQFMRTPEKIYLNHGEGIALRALQYRLRTELNLNAEIPAMGSRVQLF